MLIPVAIHKDTDSLYGVTVPDIPGCFSAGETIEEALSNTREAIVFHLEGMLEDGEAVTVSTRQIEELARIDAYAEAHHETRSGLLAKAAERYLSEQRAHETN